MANPRLPMGKDNVKHEADEAEAPAKVGKGTSPGEPKEGGSGIHGEVHRAAIEHAPGVAADGFTRKSGHQPNSHCPMPAVKDGRKSWRGGK